jgi:NHL repeat
MLLLLLVLLLWPCQCFYLWGSAASNTRALRNVAATQKLLQLQQQKLAVLLQARLYDGDGDEDNADNFEYSDDEYDAYFKKVEDTRLKSLDKLAYDDYYGDINRATAAGTMPNITVSLQTEAEAGPLLSRLQFIAIPTMILGTTFIGALSQRKSFLKEFLSVREVDHPLDPRTVRRPFSKDDLRKVIAKADAAGVETLPSIPRVLPGSSEFLTGSAEALAAELAAGRVVLYHFWRSSCQDSIASLQALEAVAAAHSSTVTVVSVHTPKYDGERGADVAAAAVTRALAGSSSTLQYIVHDPDITLWKNLGVDDWPAVAITAASSKSSAQHALFAALGERVSATSFTADAAAVTVERYSSGASPRVTAQPKPLPAVQQQQLLQDPSGLAVDVANSRLYIADTGNNRVLVCDLAGKCLAVLGGAEGLADGRTSEAKFNQPRGLALDRINQVSTIQQH